MATIVIGLPNIRMFARRSIHSLGAVGGKALSMLRNAVAAVVLAAVSFEFVVPVVSLGVVSVLLFSFASLSLRLRQSSVLCFCHF